MTNDGRGGHPAVAARAKHPRPEGLREPKTREPKTREPKTREPKTRDPKTRYTKTFSSSSTLVTPPTLM